MATKSGGLTQNQLQLLSQKIMLEQYLTAAHGAEATSIRAKIRSIDEKLVAPQKPTPVQAKKPAAKPAPAATSAPAVSAPLQLPAALTPAVSNPVIPELAQIPTELPALPTIGDAARDVAASEPIDPLTSQLAESKRKRYGIAATSLTGELGLSSLGGIATRTLLG